MQATTEQPVKKIFLSCDHAGVDLKNHLRQFIEEALSHITQSGTIKPSRVECIDLGVHTTESVDYPDCANRLALALKTHQGSDGKAIGVLICGSGIGISIAANRHPHIRAALVNEPLSAQLSRQHNDANVICFGARLVGTQMAEECVRIFFNTPFEGGRHEKRIAKLTSVHKELYNITNV